jgi:hypothetical protein
MGTKRFPFSDKVSAGFLPESNDIFHFAGDARQSPWTREVFILPTIHQQGAIP